MIEQKSEIMKSLPTGSVPHFAFQINAKMGDFVYESLFFTQRCKIVIDNCY